MVLAFCIKFHLFIFNTFKDMPWTILLLQKLGREITVITCDRVKVLALCTSSYCRLLMYQVSLNSLLYFQRYALDNHLLQILRRVVTCNRVMALASAISLMAFYQCIKFIYLQYFKRYAPDRL